ncbi:MAG: hypothetical protein AUI15_30685 [Actinobacteria bacterium 13_2_20CM_2_66_6]|nr:MAG: hypothetical protein AUI15_30685 [Actinobacteria bacterium 13_2_20CM_2_66_6]
MSEVSVSSSGSLAPRESTGTLGAIAGPALTPEERAGASGVSKAFPHAAGVEGTGLLATAAHAPCPAGSDVVPAEDAFASAPKLHAAAGPESWHWEAPAGRLRFGLALPARASQLESGPQADCVGCSDGMLSTAGEAASATTVRWLETAMKTTAR